MKKLLIISGKGGTGKTTVASSLIALTNCKAFADCDVDAPNLHITNRFTVPPTKKDFIGGDIAHVDAAKCIGCGKCKTACRFDAIEIHNGKAEISDYSCEGCAVCEYVCQENAIRMEEDVAGKVETYQDDRVFTTAVLKMGRGNSGKLVTEVKNTLFAEAESEIAILDGSPGVGCPVMASLSGVDAALIVTEPTESGKSDLARIYKTVSLCCVKGAVCVNKADINPHMTADIENWCMENHIPFVGAIPYDKEAVSACNAGDAVIHRDSKAGEAIIALYHNLLPVIENNNMRK